MSNMISWSVLLHRSVVHAFSSEIVKIVREKQYPYFFSIPSGWGKLKVLDQMQIIIIF